MCKQCELDPEKGILMNLEPLDMVKAREVILPASWQQLRKIGFHEDLLDRAVAHMAWSERTGDPVVLRNARAFLSAVGKGFQTPFDSRAFAPEKGDTYYELKLRALEALEELSLEFGSRVSSVVWDSLAHLATRSEPETERSILKEADTLPHHYGIVDTMLHAIGKVYTFSLRVQSVFSEKTGRILVHNCDCSCSLVNLAPIEGVVRYRIDERQRHDATQSLITHMCAESHLLLNSKLPFEYTITGDAMALLGLQFF